MEKCIEFSKANPGRFTYTTVGPQTTQCHRHGNDGTPLRCPVRTHVPGKGGGEGILAVLGGHINAMVESPACGIPRGQRRFGLLFLLNQERSKKWPNVPTIRELGYDYTFDGVDDARSGIECAKG